MEISDLKVGRSIGFLNPIAQLMICSVSGCRNSRPAGVSGSSLCVSDMPLNDKKCVEEGVVVACGSDSGDDFLSFKDKE